MSASSNGAAKQHGQLPVVRVRNGRRPILPAVTPLTRLPLVNVWWTMHEDSPNSVSTRNRPCPICSSPCEGQPNNLHLARRLSTEIPPPCPPLLDFFQKSCAMHLPMMPNRLHPRTELLTSTYGEGGHLFRVIHFSLTSWDLPQQTLNCGPDAFVVHVTVLSCQGWWKSARTLQQDQPCTL